MHGYEVSLSVWFLQTSNMYVELTIYMQFYAKKKATLSATMTCHSLYPNNGIHKV